MTTQQKKFFEDLSALCAANSVSMSGASDRKVAFAFLKDNVTFYALETTGGNISIITSTQFSGGKQQQP